MYLLSQEPKEHLISSLQKSTSEAITKVFPTGIICWRTRIQLESLLNKTIKDTICFPLAATTNNIAF